MKDDIIMYCQNILQLNASQQSKNFLLTKRGPWCAYTLLEYILKLNDKEKYLRLDKLFNSFIQDFLHGLAKGKMITPKHFFVSIGALQHFKSKKCCRYR